MRLLFSISFLLTLAFACYGQKSADKFKDQSPTSAEVLLQTDSPIFLSVVNIDNSDSLFQKVNFTMQNISNKSIRAYTLVGRNITTSIFTKKLFQPEQVNNEEYYEERANIKPNMVISLSIDYVEFEDGTSWGADIRRQSEHIAGFKNGETIAIEKFRELIKNRDLKTLQTLFQQKLTQINAPIADSKQTEKWQRGFEQGYKSVIFNLRGNKEQDLNALSKQLDEIENLR